MINRLELQTMLEAILGSDNVYFQPPTSKLIKYDAIIYSRSNIENTHASDKVYKQNYVYTVTAIYKNPDSDLPKKLSKLPECRFDRSYVSDNLYHDVFSITINECNSINTNNHI